MVSCPLYPRATAVDDFYEVFFNWLQLYLLGGADDRPGTGLSPAHADQRRVATSRDPGSLFPAPAEGRLIPQHELGATRAG
jgi:hypothetical protein